MTSLTFWFRLNLLFVFRGMAAGLYIDRKIIKTGKLEDLSEEELELKMKKILDDYAPILNAKQVDALPLEITETKEKKS